MSIWTLMHVLSSWYIANDHDKCLLHLKLTEKKWLVPSTHWDQQFSVADLWYVLSRPASCQPKLHWNSQLETPVGSEGCPYTGSSLLASWHQVPSKGGQWSAECQMCVALHWVKITYCTWKLRRVVYVATYIKCHALYLFWLQLSYIIYTGSYIHLLPFSYIHFLCSWHCIASSPNC